MPRSLRRLLVVVGSSLALVMLGLALWVVPSRELQAAADALTTANNSSLAAINPSTERYCSNWDFRNNTGQDVNDLHVRLKSVKNVSDVYTGTLNPFGSPDGTSGYDAGTDTYRLNFSGATVFDSDQIQIGLCTDAPLVRLGQPSPSFYWTLTGTQVLSNPLFAGLEWNWQSRSYLRVHVVNEQNISMTLMTLNLLDAGNALTLDDLNSDVTNQLPIALEILSDPQPLAPNGDSFFDVFFDVTQPPTRTALLEPNHPYVLEVTLAADDDPGNTAHLLSQGLSPLIPLYLPVIIK